MTLLISVSRLHAGRGSTDSSGGLTEHYNGTEGAPISGAVIMLIIKLPTQPQMPRKCIYSNRSNDDSGIT